MELKMTGEISERLIGLTKPTRYTTADGKVFEWIDGEYKEIFRNHIHRCEYKLLGKKCKRVKRKKDMGDRDICDYCEHLIIVNLNDEGDKITGIER